MCVLWQRSNVKSVTELIDCKSSAVHNSQRTFDWVNYWTRHSGNSTKPGPMIILPSQVPFFFNLIRTDLKLDGRKRLDCVQFACAKKEREKRMRHGKAPVSRPRSLSRPAKNNNEVGFVELESSAFDEHTEALQEDCELGSDEDSCFLSNYGWRPGY